MWNPKDRDTLALFKCKQPDLGLESFTTFPVSDNSLFTLNTDEIESIKVVERQDNIITYEEYLQRHGVLIHHQCDDGLHVNLWRLLSLLAHTRQR